MSQERKYVRPAREGLKVALPPAGGQMRGHLPPEGREVRWSSYWERRLRDGDIKLGRKPSGKAKSAGGSK